MKIDPSVRRRIIFGLQLAVPVAYGIYVFFTTPHVAGPDEPCTSMPVAQARLAMINELTRRGFSASDANSFTVSWVIPGDGEPAYGAGFLGQHNGVQRQVNIAVNGCSVTQVIELQSLPQ